jgi:hypothetical protein
MNTNYIKDLKTFILSPIFPILLGSTIFILYVVYFTPVSLCDGGLDLNDILNLKQRLHLEIKDIAYNCEVIDDRKYAIRQLDFYTSKNTNGGFIQRTI